MESKLASSSNTTKDLFDDYVLKVRDQADRLRECNEIEVGEEYLRYLLKDWKEVLEDELNRYNLNK